MPLEIRGNRQRVPAGEFWKARHPETGEYFQALSFESLVKNIAAYNKKNGYPVGLDFDKIVESWVCMYMPGQCQDQALNQRPRHRLSMASVLSGSAVMLKFIANGRQLVPRSEAERRAKICAQCYNNQPFKTGCGGLCAELRKAVQAIVRGGGTTYDDNLHACAICKCWLSSSVFVPLDVQCVGVTDEMKAEFGKVPNCWKTEC